jgi:hypothetical protein
MIIFTNIRIKPETLSEAEVGRFEYLRAGRIKPTGRHLSTSNLYLVIEGEILVSPEELQQHKKEKDLEKPPLPIDKPFESWEELLDAVGDRTPQARKILRYLEDFGYQDLLKRKRVVVKPDGTKAVRWENYTVDKDEVAELSLEHGKSFDTGADYMRYMFSQLQELAPRAKPPEFFGGRRLHPGATESKKELAKRLRPIVDEIMRESRGQVLVELRHLFENTIPDEWVDAILGPNNENVKYGEDPSVKGQHFGDVRSVIANTVDYEEAQRKERVLTLMKMRAADSETPEIYDEHIDKLEDEVRELNKTSQIRAETIYIITEVDLRNFIGKLIGEIKSIEPTEAGVGHTPGEHETAPLFVIPTSLSDLPSLINLLDPSKSKILGKPSKSRMKLTGGRRGFRRDMNEIIEQAVRAVYGPEAEVKRFDSDGNIYYEMGKEELPPKMGPKDTSERSRKKMVKAADKFIETGDISDVDSLINKISSQVEED